jgi:hypothetical protein
MVCLGSRGRLDADIDAARSCPSRHGSQIPLIHPRRWEALAQLGWELNQVKALWSNRTGSRLASWPGRPPRDQTTQMVAVQDALVSSSTRARSRSSARAVLLSYRVAQQERIIQVVELLWLG